jgi:hypothetical protein
MQLSAEETLLLSTARPALHDSDDAVLRRLLGAPVKWPLLLWRAENSRTLSPLGHHLSRLQWINVPAPVRAYLERWQQVSDLRTRVMYAELGRIVRAFSDAGVEYHLIKGSTLGPLYYPSVFLRPMQDLDIMVQPQQALRARQVLFELGYAHGIWNPGDNQFRRMWPRVDRAYLQSHHELPSVTRVFTVPSPYPAAQIPASWRHKHIKCFVDEHQAMTIPVFIDLHVNLSAGMDLADVWCGAQHEEVFGRLVRVQSPTTMLWFLAARLYHEAFEYGTLKLNMFGDLDAVLRQRAGQIAWERILAIAVKYAMSAPLYYVLAQARAIAAAPVPVEVIEALRPKHSEVPVTNDWGDIVPKMLSRAELHPVTLA